MLVNTMHGLFLNVLRMVNLGIADWNNQDARIDVFSHPHEHPMGDSHQVFFNHQFSRQQTSRRNIITSTGSWPRKTSAAVFSSSGISVFSVRGLKFCSTSIRDWPHVCRAILDLFNPEQKPGTGTTGGTRATFDGNTAVEVTQGQAYRLYQSITRCCGRLKRMRWVHLRHKNNQEYKTHGVRYCPNAWSFILRDMDYLHIAVKKGALFVWLEGVCHTHRYIF